MAGKTVLYVCGPMSGLPGLNFDAFFEADKKLRDAGFDVLNPADRAGRTPDMPWSWYLRRCIKDVADADGLAVLPGAGSSKGARLELTIAEELGMATMTVAGWIDVAPFHTTPSRSL